MTARDVFVACCVLIVAGTTIRILQGVTWLLNRPPRTGKHS